MIFWILIVSFIAKALTRMWLVRGTSIWETGYKLYYEIARNLLAEGRFYSPVSYNTDVYLAPRTPLYPLFIAGVLQLGKHSDVFFILLQALISTLTCVWVFQITKKIASDGAALWAALLCAIFPYSFFHDTQLQETGLYTCLSTLAILSLVSALEKKTAKAFFVAGIISGLAALTRASHLIHTLIFVPFIFFWIKDRRIPSAAALVLGLFLCIAPWMIRNHKVVGTFSLTTETGMGLLKANHPFVFDFYPAQSIDKSSRYFLDHLNQVLDETQQRELEQTKGNEIAQNRWFTQWAFNYMKQHPAQTLKGGLIKTSVNFSGILSPQKGRFENFAYFLSYWVWTLLAFVGITAVRRTPFAGIFFILCFSQAALSFVFWAHTSHRAFLDPLLAVLAGIGMEMLCKKNQPSLV